MRRKVWVGLALAGLAGIASPLLLDREQVPLDAAARAELRQRGHAFAELPAGVLHYELAGPEAAPVVVLVDGLAGPMEVWDATAGAVEDAGFRTLRFDHFGSGWSERIGGDYDLDRYVAELEQLVQTVVPDAGPLLLVGSSMGAIVVTEYALRHPERVDKIALVGPAGFPLGPGLATDLVRVPGLGEYVMKGFGDRSLLQWARRRVAQPDRFETFLHRFERQLEIRGTKSAILSTIRHMPLDAYVDRYPRLGELDRPVLIIWGAQDRIVPYAHHEAAMQAVPQAEFVTVDDAGHLPMLEQPQAVLPRLIPFLMQGIARGHGPYR